MSMNAVSSKEENAVEKFSVSSVTRQFIRADRQQTSAAAISSFSFTSLRFPIFAKRASHLPYEENPYLKLCIV